MTLLPFFVESVSCIPASVSSARGADNADRYLIATIAAILS
jgi:hypothetical protein